jgi:putative membrane protein insertion efficiency factor
MNQHKGHEGHKRIVWLVSVAGLLVLLGGQPIAIAGIHLYQQTVAPLAARAGVRCRFTTSCSRYAEAAIAREGLAVGGVKALKRIARCGPWTPSGTIDAP